MSKISKPFLEPQKRVDLAVADLARRVKYAGLVTVVSGEQFVGTTDGSGNPTIFYETEAATVARDYEWRTRTNPVQFDDIFSTKLPITLNKHITQGVRTTPEQEYFDEIRYGRDVLPPATKAVANKLNAKIETSILDNTNLKVTTLTLGGAGALTAALSAGGVLRQDFVLGQLLEIQMLCDDMGMPVDGRFLLAGKNAYKFVASSGLLRDYDLSKANTVFRRGVRGQIDIVDMELVNGSTLLGDNDFQVVHKSWAVMPTSRGQMPESNVTWAKASTVDGFDIRIQRGYDMNFDRNGQVIHTYWNINEINDEIRRHTRASAASAADGSEAGDPVITNDAIVTTGKNVRRAAGTFSAAAPSA